MKTRNFIIKFFSTFILFSLFVYAKSNRVSKPFMVGKAIAMEMLYLNTNKNDRVKVDLQNVRNKLHRLDIDRGFSLKSVSIDSAIEDGAGLDISGFLLFSDKLGRFINVKFDTFCFIKNRHDYDVQSLKISYLSRPRTLIFMVPSRKLSIRRLKKSSFTQALQSVKFVARRLKGYDEMPRKYTIVAFLLDKINKNSRVYGVVSDNAFSPIGKLGVSIKTRDGWRIVVSKPDMFAYNGDIAKYFNLFWKDSGYLVAISSYSTQGLVKAIQIALENLGYSIGMVDGILNQRTKKAIKRYLKKSKFYSKSKIDDDLLWFMQQKIQIDVQKTVQLTLSQVGINIGKVDGKIGPMSIRGLKKFQRKMGLRADGRITPKLVRLLVRVSRVVDVNSSMRRFLRGTVFLRKYQDKMWNKELR